MQVTIYIMIKLMKPKHLTNENYKIVKELKRNDIKYAM